MLKALAYLCGPTTDKKPHLGNYKTFYRSINHFKSLKKFFKSSKLMMNFTDISQSVIKASLKSGKTIRDHNNEVIRSTVKTLRVLGLKPWTIDLKRCSLSKKKIDSFLSKTLKNFTENCEEVDSGILYHPSKDVRESFHLWRVGLHLSNPFWGESLPGWHIECAALNHYHSKNLKPLIHYGGQDLKDLHHKNEEILLNLYAKKSPLFWFRVGALMIEGTKMSKSLGNEVRIDPSFKEKDYHALRSLLNKGSLENCSKISKREWTLNSLIEEEVKVTSKKLYKLSLKRKKLRDNKNFQGSDLIRKKLEFKGYTVRDYGNKFKFFKLKNNFKTLIFN